jgi:hypothetical protein
MGQQQQLFGYFPFSGCLENLTGPVNGNWTLTVVDGQAQDVGNLIDFEVIFCDPSGINCISCAADAGYYYSPISPPARVPPIWYSHCHQTTLPHPHSPRLPSTVTLMPLVVLAGNSGHLLPNRI